MSIAKTIFYHECLQPTNQPTIHYRLCVGGGGGEVVKTILTNRFDAHILLHPMGHWAIFTILKVIIQFEKSSQIQQLNAQQLLVKIAAQ